MRPTKDGPKFDFASAGNDVDTEQSAEERKRFYAALEASPGETPTPSSCGRRGEGHFSQVIENTADLGIGPSPNKSNEINDLANSAPVGVQDPNRKHAFKDAMTQAGSPDPRNDRFCITSLCPRQFPVTLHAAGS